MKGRRSALAGWGLLSLFGDLSVAQKTLPFATSDSSECMRDCIDAGNTFCVKPPGIFGVCCQTDKCGDLTACSASNRSIGARYLQCFTDDFCGERNHVASQTRNEIVFNEVNYSPGNGCIWSFNFNLEEANLGDLLIVEVEDITNTDLYYAQGMTEWDSVGRSVRNPLVALFKVRFPNQLYLTLRNNDVVKTALEKPIVITYWVAPTDPTKKVEEYST